MMVDDKGGFRLLGEIHVLVHKPDVVYSILHFTHILNIQNVIIQTVGKRGNSNSRIQGNRIFVYLYIAFIDRNSILNHIFLSHFAMAVPTYMHIYIHDSHVVMYSIYTYWV